MAAIEAAQARLTSIQQASCLQVIHAWREDIAQNAAAIEEIVALGHEAGNLGRQCCARSDGASVDVPSAQRMLAQSKLSIADPSVSLKFDIALIGKKLGSG